MTRSTTRRLFLSAAAALGFLPRTAARAQGGTGNKPALLGGTPVRTSRWPSWPRTTELDEQRWIGVLRAGQSCRLNGKDTAAFERAYAGLTGARHCLATANGTSALVASLNALGVGPGDEVIVPPYTFVATVNAVLACYALPVFADTDVDTFQIEPRSIESAVTARTKVILPVHLGGNAADLDAILEIGRRRNLPVLEDACQAHLGEWKNRKLGAWGVGGCFSFQATKNLNSGEGGAVITSDAQFFERAWAFHNNGRGQATAGAFHYTVNGLNLRLTEFQASLLLAQMTRVEEQSRRRETNAALLTRLLEEIPGIHPERQYAGCTRNAWHLYMFRYDAREFAGLPRAAFLKALYAEGIPCSGGYSPLNREPLITTIPSSPVWERIYGAPALRQWSERNLQACPANDRLCGEGVWMVQTMLLGEKRDMEQIAEAVARIRVHAGELREAAATAASA